MADPTYGGDLQSSTLDDFVRDVAWDNFFVDTPKQAWLRAIGAVEQFTGGVMMREPTIFARPDGGSSAPGSTYTIVHRQQIADLAYNMRLYTSRDNLETFSLMVQNRGDAKRVDLMEVYAEGAIRGLNADIEVDSFHHGQAPVAGYITDDGTLRINGDEEFMNNGFDPSIFGNVFQSVGNQARNGTQTNTLNSTPYFYGNPDGTAGVFSVEGLTQHVMRVKKFNSETEGCIGISSWEGVGYIEAMFQRQQRYIEWKAGRLETVPSFEGISFMGIMIYGDTMAPGRAWTTSLPPGITGTSNATDTLTYTSGGLTIPYSFTSPATTTTYSRIPASTNISVGEPLTLYSGRTWKVRPTDVPEFFFGVRRNQVYNSNTLDAYLVNLALNNYSVAPRENCVGYGAAG